MQRVVMFGAGAIGCHLGAVWAAAGLDVTLLGRDALLAPIRTAGLKVSGGPSLQVSPAQLTCTSDPSVLRDAETIVLSVKATALQEAITHLKTHARKEATVISLLNGLRPARDLAQALPGHQIIAGMVPYNVVWTGPSALHRSSAGQLTLGASDVTRELSRKMAQSGLPIMVEPEIEAVQYGKLLLNLINPVNALSGLTLHQMLSQRGYRRIYAAALQEALQVYHRAGVHWTKAGPFSPKVAVRLLRMPDRLFNATLLRLQRIDPSSMTSMAHDLRAGKPTEIAELNQEICRLGAECSVKTPVNAGLVRLILEAEARYPAQPAGLSAHDLSAALGL